MSKKICLRSSKRLSQRLCRSESVRRLTNETRIEGRTERQKAVPFFGVSNIEESVRYYVEGLGFEMTKKWVDDGKLRWCWLERGGAALMLQEFWKEGHHANVPEGKLGQGVSICFICEDALAIY